MQAPSAHLAAFVAAKGVKVQQSPTQRIAEDIQDDFMALQVCQRAALGQLAR